MLRIVLFLVIAATMVGTLMPSRKGAAIAASDDGIVYTPQSSGSSYRVVPGDHSDTSASTRSNGGGVHLDRASDGHFYIDARVNGSPVHFLVDTGASGIALAASDARRAGFALGAMNQEIGQGASGAVNGEWVTIDSIEVAGRTSHDIPAAVLAGGEVSLLGQSALRAFSISVDGDEMVLR